jgi:hypothetical protein
MVYFSYEFKIVILSLFYSVGTSSSAEVAGVTVKLWTCIQEVLGSDICKDAGYFDCSFFVVFRGPAMQIGLHLGHNVCD